MGGIDLGAVKARIEGDTSGLEESVGRAKGILDGFSAAAVGMGAAVGTGFAIVGAAGELIQGLANGVLEAGRAMADAVAQVAAFSEHLTNLSMVTGLSVDALQSMGKAAVESGTSADSFINAVTRMETKLGSGTKQVQEAVSALGLSWKELTESSPDEAFNKVAQSLTNMTDVAERNATAQRLFGRSFQDVLPAMQAYLEAGDRYVSLSDSQVAAGLEMDRSLDELKTSWTELWQQIGATLNTPEVREGIKELAQAIRNITLAVKEGSGPIAGFFKAIAEHANNAAKWVVFLGGAFDGLKERLASATKDTPGAIAAGMKALDAFEARVTADQNKQWGREMFPGLFGGEKPKLGALGGGAEGEAAAKASLKLQERTQREAQRDMEKFGRQYNKALNDMLEVKPETMADMERQLNGMMGPIDQFNAEHKRVVEETAKFQVTEQDWVIRQTRDQYAAQENQVRESFGRQIKELTDYRNQLSLVGSDTGPVDDLIAQWKGLEAAEIRAIEQARRYAEIQNALASVGDILSELGNLFQMLGVSADSFVGRLVTGLQSATQAAQGAVAGFQAMQAGIAKGGITGILGAVSGGLGLVTGAVGVVKSIIGVFNKPEYKKIAADVGKSWGVSISDGLAKEIEQLAKQNKISRSLAELLDVSKIIGESGKDPRTFTRQIGDLMNAIKSGAVPAAQGMEELGRAFNMVADAAVKSGTVGDRALVGLIKRARELGQVTPEMKAFVGAQLDSSLEGIHKYVAALAKIGETADKSAEGQARLAEMGKTSGVVFGAMFQALVSEKGITAAVDAMKGDFESLNKTLTDTLGPDATAQILGPFGGAFATLSDETLRPIFEGIDGITQAMTGLANAGYLSIDQFGAMQDATAQLFDEAIAGGADTRTALLAVAPGIQAAISAAEQFGVPLDADMARLKAMAEQNGITFRTDPQAAMLDVLVSIAQVLGADVPESARRAAGAMQDLANSVPRDLDVNVNIHENRTGGGGYGGGTEGGAEAGAGGGTEIAPPPEYIPGSRYEGYQYGTGGIKDFGSGTPVVLHGREAVVTEKQAQGMGGGPVSVSFNPTFTVDPLMSNEGRRDLSKYQIDEFIRAVRTDPMIKMILDKKGLR